MTPCKVHLNVSALFAQPIGSLGLFMPYLLYQSTTDTPVYFNISKDGVLIYHQIYT